MARPPAGAALGAHRPAPLRAGWPAEYQQSTSPEHQHPPRLRTGRWWSAEEITGLSLFSANGLRRSLGSAGTRSSAHGQRRRVDRQGSQRFVPAAHLEAALLAPMAAAAARSHADAPPMEQAGVAIRRRHVCGRASSWEILPPPRGSPCDSRTGESEGAAARLAGPLSLAGWLRRTLAVHHGGQCSPQPERRQALCTTQATQMNKRASSPGRTPATLIFF